MARRAVFCAGPPCRRAVARGRTAIQSAPLRGLDTPPSSESVPATLTPRGTDISQPNRSPTTPGDSAGATVRGWAGHAAEPDSHCRKSGIEAMAVPSLRGGSLISARIRLPNRPSPISIPAGFGSRREPLRVEIIWRQWLAEYGLPQDLVMIAEAVRRRHFLSAPY